jgi:hypothetical protein
LNDAVITLQAVIEVPAFDAGSLPPWPVAAMAPGSWLVLNADCTDERGGCSWPPSLIGSMFSLLAAGTRWWTHCWPKN